MNWKHIITLSALSILMAGCSSIRPMSGFTIVVGNDFTEYTEQGFLFTPESYLGEYDSIGLITVRVWPEVRSAAGTASTPDGFRRVSTSEGGWFVEEIDPAGAIEDMYQQAIEMGADALTRFEADILDAQNGIIEIEILQISGFAIRRL